MLRRLLSAVVLALGACAPAASPPAPAPAAPAPAAPAPAAPAAAADAPATPERAIPYPVTPPPEYRAAVAAGTRSASGAPGPAYWQNWSDYRIRTRLDPAARRIEGEVDIRYHNRSPDTLRVLVLDLTQNFHAPGALRLEAAEVTGGIELSRVRVRGQELSAEAASGPRYVVQGTKLILLPPAPVLPGDSVDLGMEWGFTVPQAGAGARMGYSGDDLFYIAYWYPQMAVYDDVVGWHPDPFLGPAEFYSGFGSYDVTFEAPAGWLVRGTGRLTNPEEVLAPPILERLRLAEQSDTVVSILAGGADETVTRTSADGWLRWRFRADSVRDVAYTAALDPLWDAARTPVGDLDGDGDTDYTRVEAVYREPAFRWQNVAEYEQHVIRFLSEYTGLPYPWPHMTAVEGAGIIGGGMEFPMMTLMGDYTAMGDSALYAVTAHELAHMWIPMIVATDERRYSWIDEGFTTFNEGQARADYFPGSRPALEDRLSYLTVALQGMEGEIMRQSAYHYSSAAFGTASYSKPATVLVALRGLLGTDTFTRAYREFVDRWAYRHPYPWDLWNTFEDVAGRDLDWFWRSWYYETWILDQAVGSVAPLPDGGTTIVVEDRGEVPMPARLTITRADGTALEREVPVEVWLEGARTAEVEVPEGAPVTRVEIDAANAFPDADPGNNVWVSTAR